MSGDSKRLRSPNAAKLDSSSLEKLLQSIVNNLSQILDSLQVDSKTFHKFESIFEKSSTLDQVILAISQMSEVAARRLAHPPNSAGALPAINPQPCHPCVSEPPSHKKSRHPAPKDAKPIGFDDPTTDASAGAEIGSQNYEGLEKLLQKYEAEIRDHIRIEQQMKIYSDSLEESMAELEGRVRRLETENAESQGKCLELQRELSGLRSDPKTIKARVVKRSNAASDLSIAHSRHFKQISVDHVG